MACQVPCNCSSTTIVQADGKTPGAAIHVEAPALGLSWGSVAEKGRVGDWRGNGRRMGVAVAGGFRNAGASLPAMAPFPVAALRTGQADLPHPALQWDHAFRTRNTLATAGSR